MHNVVERVDGVLDDSLNAKQLEARKVLDGKLGDINSVEFIDLTNKAYRSSAHAEGYPNHHVGCYPELKNTYSNSGNGMYAIIDGNGRVFVTNHAGVQLAQDAGYKQLSDSPVSFPYGVTEIFEGSKLNKRASSLAVIFMRDTFGTWNV